MPRGSKPGERRGGRKKGTPNKATACIRDVAQVYTDQAIQTLADVMLNGDSAAARVAAANAILDRGYGKPAQSMRLGGDEDAPPIEQVIRWANDQAEATPDPSKR